MPRDSVVIATKSHAPDRPTLLAELDESLRRIRTDHVDIFQLHGVNSHATMDKVLSPGGAMEGMAEGIRAGKIRFGGFSSHSLAIAAEMIRTNRFDMVQVPFNFVDSQAEEEVIPLARAADMGIIAMKPLGGGLLDDVHLCFRFLRQFEGVVPDPGIEASSQLREILGVMDVRGPLTIEERASMERYRQQLGKEWCHRCDYCQPCPRHISISKVLSAKSFARRMPVDKVRFFVEAAFKEAENCERMPAVRGAVPLSSGHPRPDEKAARLLGHLPRNRKLGITPPRGGSAGASRLR